MRERTVALVLCPLAGAAVLACLGFYAFGTIRDNDRTVRGIRANIGRPVDVAGLSEATVVTMDRESVYVMARAAGGPLALRRVDRRDASFSAVPATRQAGTVR